MIPMTKFSIYQINYDGGNQNFSSNLNDKFCKDIFKIIRKFFYKCMIKTGIPAIIILFILTFRKSLYKGILKNKKYLGKQHGI
jgi:hypothetical protein